MTPPSIVLTIAELASPLGPLLIASDGWQRVRALDFADGRPRMDALLQRAAGARACEQRSGCAPRAVREALRAYFGGQLSALDELEFECAGTPFQRSVWTALRAIAPGQTVSYAELARRVGRPSAARAVGAANGQNPVALIVPCHRAIGSDGSLTGYAAGLARKRWLLRHEREHARAERSSVAASA